MCVEYQHMSCTEEEMMRDYASTALVDTSKYEKPEECPICYESTENIRAFECCGHWVGEMCFQKSFLQTSVLRCPTCRAEKKVGNDFMLSKYKAIYMARLGTDCVYHHETFDVSTIAVYRMFHYSRPTSPLVTLEDVQRLNDACSNDVMKLCCTHLTAAFNKGNFNCVMNIMTVTDDTTYVSLVSDHDDDLTELDLTIIYDGDEVTEDGSAVVYSGGWRFEVPLVERQPTGSVQLSRPSDVEVVQVSTAGDFFHDVRPFY